MVDRTIDIGRGAMPLEVGNNHLTTLAESRKDRPKHLARGEAAMQQDQRPPDAIRLVIQVDAVDLGIFAMARCFVGRIGGHVASPHLCDGSYRGCELDDAAPPDSSLRSTAT